MRHIDTPAIDKLHEAMENVDFISDFLAWLVVNNGYYLVDTSGRVVDPVHDRVKDLVMSYYDVDMSEVEKEKQEVIAYLSSIVGCAKGTSGQCVEAVNE